MTSAGPLLGGTLEQLSDFLIRRLREILVPVTNPDEGLGGNCADDVVHFICQLETGRGLRDGDRNARLEIGLEDVRQLLMDGFSTSETGDHCLLASGARTCGYLRIPSGVIAMRSFSGSVGAICGLMLSAMFLLASEGDHRPALRSPPPTHSAAGEVRGAHAPAALPLSFEANVGQLDGRAKFVARQNGADLFFTADGLVLSLQDPAAADLVRRGSAASARGAAPRVIRLSWLGAKLASIAGLEEMAGKANYLRGSDPAKWRAGISTYRKLKYEHLYPGVDLVFYGNPSRLEYDFVLAPGADPSVLRLGVEGADRVEINDRGELLLSVAGRLVKQEPPRVYQRLNGEARYVDGAYALVGSNELAFRLGEYDRKQPLVIDPVIDFSTYVGGSNWDYARGIAVDGSGNAYVIGQTTSINFPVAGDPVQPTFGGAVDAFVLKLSPDSSKVLYSTYLGGSREDVAYGVAVDRWGNACITGYTSSPDFPLANAIQPRYGGGEFDAFIVKLNPQGSAFVYSTYLGGSDADSGRGIAVDLDGNAYVVGSTSSRDFPVVNAFQPTFGGPMADAFVARLNTEGNEFFYSTYLGGRLYDAAFGVTADISGNTYVVGTTGSPDFPTYRGAFSTIGGGGGEFGDFDAFVAKFLWNGSLIYSTFLGGSNVDQGNAIAVDHWGNVYVTGDTVSRDFPVLNAFQPNWAGSRDAFVAKLNIAGDELLYATYLGGSGMEQGYGIAVEPFFGAASVIGYTTSNDFPISNPIQDTNHGAEDVFVTTLSPEGTWLPFSTYFGGAGQDIGFGIALDAYGNAYLAGSTSSRDFPTVSSMQWDLPGLLGGFVAKVEPEAP